jgi:hypothetical protein
MPFKVGVDNAGGELVVLVPGDSIEVWELKDLVLLKAPNLVAVTRFDLFYVDAVGAEHLLTKYEVVKPGVLPVAVPTTVIVKRIDGACVVDVCVMGDEGAVWASEWGRA